MTMASFYFSPDPLLRALPHLRVLNSPPPPGRREERAMISICRGVLAYGLPLSHRPVPSHSLIARSTARNRLAGHPRRFVKLIVYPIRSGEAVSASSSRRRCSRCFPGLRACGLAFIFSPIRYERRGDDVLVVSIYGRYRWRAGAFHIRSFYFDTVLFSFAYAVPSCSLLVRYEKRDGGLFVVPRPVICPLVAVVDGVADGDGVPIDGV